MKIVVIDGQGGRMGKSIIEQIRKSCPDEQLYTLYALGTNSTATLAMIKAGPPELIPLLSTPGTPT